MKLTSYSYVAPFGPSVVMQEKMEAIRKFLEPVLANWVTQFPDKKDWKSRFILITGPDNYEKVYKLAGKQLIRTQHGNAQSALDTLKTELAFFTAAYPLEQARLSLITSAELPAGVDKDTVYSTRRCPTLDKIFNPPSPKAPVEIS